MSQACSGGGGKEEGKGVERPRLRYVMTPKDKAARARHVLPTGDKIQRGHLKDSARRLRSGL